MAVNATAIWRVRPSGSNTNGGGYDPGISGAATDYSQQNAAQATGVNGTASGTTTFSDSTANAFTAAMVGNAIWIASGAGFTVGAYFVTAFTSASTVTLDRSPGTGTVAHWALGGGWADFFTNTTSSGPLVPGNVVYILGSGTPNPSSYVYDYTMSSNATVVSGNSTAGCITFANDPSTPGYKAPPDTTGGMPCVKTSATLIFTNGIIEGVYFVSSASATSALNFSNAQGIAIGCVHDQFSSDTSFASLYTQGGGAYGCEAFSSSGGSGGSSFAISVNFASFTFTNGCNIHDTVGAGISMQNSCSGGVINTIVAKCSGTSIILGTGVGIHLQNLTIDGSTGNGIEITTQACLSVTTIINCIISNHTGVGKFALTIDAGSAATNNQVKLLIDYNSFYNNTTNYNAISAGPHDTALGVTPYVASSTENYALS